MSTSAMHDQLQKISQFADHATRMMIVKVTAVDLTNGDCTVDPQDGGNTLTDVPFFGNDPIVGDLCLAFSFDGNLVVMGNASLKAKITTNSDPVTAASGWAVQTAYMDYGTEVCELYINMSRTGGNITGSTGGDITNTLVCTVRSGLPFPATQVGISSIGGNRQVGAVLESDGQVYLTFLGPNLTFNTGFTFNASATYVRGN